MQASSYLCLVRRLPNIQVTALVVISSLGRPSVSDRKESRIRTRWTLSVRFQRCLSGHYPGEGMDWGR